MSMGLLRPRLATATNSQAVFFSATNTHSPVRSAPGTQRRVDPDLMVLRRVVVHRHAGQHDLGKHGEVEREILEQVLDQIGERNVRGRGRELETGGPARLGQIGDERELRLFDVEPAGQVEGVVGILRLGRW